MSKPEHYINQYREFYSKGGYGNRPHHQSLVAKERIKEALVLTNSKTLLDYGCGDGLQYKKYGLKEFFGVDALFCYDPGVLEFEKKPTKEEIFDAVINTDVLEHIPVGEDENVIKEIFSYASKMVYFRIATSPAKNLLPNGENAHCNLRSHFEWVDLIRKYKGDNHYVIVETTGRSKGLTIL